MQLVEDLRNSFVCGLLCICAQGLAVLQAASKDFEWDIQVGEVTRILCSLGPLHCGLLSL